MSKKKKKHGLKRSIYALSFIIYLAVLFYFLFFAELFGRTHLTGEYHYNLTLFNEILLYWNNRASLGFFLVFINLAGNVIAFVPFGIFVPSLFPKKNGKFCKVLLEGFLFSLGVECIQLVTQVGTFDVDDILLNTMGVVIGFILFAIARQVRKKKR